MSAKKMIVTAALPYANGSIHLGHLLEYIQADIFVRYQRMSGREVYYFCADDTHGAPIMIRARNENVAPEDIIARYQNEHKKDFDDFLVSFDNYHSTNSEENKELSKQIFLELTKKGHISKREIEQTYCETDGMFLPDRFVVGTCPKCGAQQQYGDVCEACSSHYSATDLKSAKCSLCGNAPVMKKSDHYFFRVGDFKETLEKFVHGSALSSEIQNFLKNWFKEGLKEWDISRDGPYFGFLIPGETDKYFYVWLDAPVGYIASAKNYADKNGAVLEDFWNNDCEIRHFIGKDIVYFHTLFWIPMLEGAGFSLPSRITVHGFLNVNGEKMSKSKGTFISARNYLDVLDPEYLRYYYASKLKDSINDIDLSMSDFMFRVNAELVNKIANLGSRAISMLKKNKSFKGRLGAIADSERDLLAQMCAEGKLIANDFENCDFASAVKKAVAIADRANLFIDKEKPWELKDNPARQQEVLTAAINAFRLVAIYLKPIVPEFSAKCEKILAVSPFVFDDCNTLLENHQIGEFVRLADRIEEKSVEKIMDNAKNNRSPKDNKAMVEEEVRQIEYKDFAKLELLTARVEAAEKVEKADRLLKLTLNDGTTTRCVVAGLAEHCTPDELVGKNVVIVANLKPRKLRGIESKGMVLAINDGEGLKVLFAGDDVNPGSKVS